MGEWLLIYGYVFMAGVLSEGLHRGHRRRPWLSSLVFVCGFVLCVFFERRLPLPPNNLQFCSPWMLLMTERRLDTSRIQLSMTRIQLSFTKWMLLTTERRLDTSRIQLSTTRIQLSFTKWMLLTTERRLDTSRIQLSTNMI